MSYTVYINYKGNSVGVLNLSFGTDGSLYLNELVSKTTENPLFIVNEVSVPYDLLGRSGLKIPMGKQFYSTNRVKFSHHPSGSFQISGEKPGSIFSGIDQSTGKPKGVSVSSFDLTKVTNDGGPIITANIWGLNHLSYKKSKTSEEIVFSENTMRHQRMTYEGNRTSFTILIFHLAESFVQGIEKEQDWISYKYHFYKKPLKLRVIDSQHASGYKIGIACLLSRTFNQEPFGIYLAGGVTRPDPETRISKNIIVRFSSNENSRLEEEGIILGDSLDYSITGLIS